VPLLLLAAPLPSQNFSTFLDGDKYVGPDMAARILGGGPQLASLDD
jgi:hypothetical protein